MRTAFLLLGAILAWTAQAEGGPAPALTSEDAWIRAAPPGARVMAGYVQLVNRGDVPLRCDAASGADFGAIEIHRTLIEEGQSRMLRDQVVEIPAHGRAALAPGGYHLMLFRPQRPLSPGDRSLLTLECGEIRTTIEFTVRAAD
ncbi:copper chaperone PCu(A)C [Fontimonas sp. SYSU GA230001]|uniref:copper chaperone PCu(A)C n=1 Tax=Fontimonas sp. SYSU GA230001 TaxID=3142450 RepID=UPI0032B623E3